MHFLYEATVTPSCSSPFCWWGTLALHCAVMQRTTSSCVHFILLWKSRDLITYEIDTVQKDGRILLGIKVHMKEGSVQLCAFGLVVDYQRQAGKLFCFEANKRSAIEGPLLQQIHSQGSTKGSKQCKCLHRCYCPFSMLFLHTSEHKACKTCVYVVEKWAIIWSW